MKTSDLAFDLHQAFAATRFGGGAPLYMHDDAAKWAWECVAEKERDTLGAEAKAEIADLKSRISELECEIRAIAAGYGEG